MALSNAQLADCRRFMGYPAQGSAVFDSKVDTAYAWLAPGVYTTLFTRLDTMTPSEESILANKFLTNLNTLEDAIVSTGSNLDTNKAAVWEHNANEQNDREALYTSWRRKLCEFLGFPPGPGLASESGSVRLVRC